MTDRAAELAAENKELREALDSLTHEVIRAKHERDFAIDRLSLV